MEISEILETVMKVISQFIGEDSNEDLGETLGELYDSLVGNYRPLIKVLPLIVGKLSKDVTPLITAIKTVIPTMLEDEDYIEITEKNCKNIARSKYQKFKVLTSCGFTREEALSLLLAENND